MIKKNTIIGRKAEQEVLRECIDSERSEFVALYGRRRVGKTFLVREIFEDDFVFYATGILDGDQEAQLANFNEEISKYGGSALEPARNWREAFNNLYSLIESSKRTTKKVVFLDEIPWMNTTRSDFLSALDHFWNRWVSLRGDVLLIICGSAASWIIDNIVNNIGGLHNRLTRHIHLSPFTLRECEAYYYAKGLGSRFKGAGTKYLQRMRVRTPTNQNIPALVKMLQGCDLADVPILTLTIDPCISCTER